VLDDEWLRGRRLRYLALRPLIDYLKSLDQSASTESGCGLTGQMANLIERGGIRRNRQRTHRFGRVWVAVGMESILQALAHPGEAITRPALEPWMLRDESADGMGFTLSESSMLSQGKLVAVCWDPAENSWQLLASRWSREAEGEHLVGTQRLSRHPKRVEIQAAPDTPEITRDRTWAVYLPMTHTDQNVSNLLLPQSHYRHGACLLLRDGDLMYRLRLGAVQEGHDDWLRVAMEVIGREQLAAAA
jgi:hypothetical protein